MMIMVMVVLVFVLLVGIELCFILKKCEAERLLERKKRFIPETEKISRFDREYAQEIALEIMKGESKWNDQPRYMRRQIAVGLYEILYDMPDDPEKTERSRMVKNYLDSFLEDIRHNRVLVYERILEMWECGIFVGWINEIICDSAIRGFRQKYKVTS